MGWRRWKLAVGADGWSTRTPPRQQQKGQQYQTTTQSWGAWRCACGNVQSGSECKNCHLKWWQTTWEKVDTKAKANQSAKKKTQSPHSLDQHQAHPCDVGEVLNLLTKQLQGRPDLLAQVQLLHAQLAPTPAPRPPRVELKSIIDRKEHQKHRLRTLNAEIKTIKEQLHGLMAEQAAVQAELTSLGDQEKELLAKLQESTSEDEGEDASDDESDPGPGQPAVTPTASQMDLDWEGEKWDDADPEAAERWVGFVTAQSTTLPPELRRQLATALLGGGGPAEPTEPSSDHKKARTGAAA